MFNIIKLNAKDNIAVAPMNIPSGSEINSTLKAQTNIPFGHKISLEDIKNLESTFKNQLIFNGIFSIWAEYTSLMHEFHIFSQMNALETDTYIDNLTQRLINRYNTQYTIYNTYAYAY